MNKRKMNDRDQNTVLVFDLETTGLTPKDKSYKDLNKWPYIVQISWIVFDLNYIEIISIQDNIIKCPIKIPEQSTKIHKISDDISQKQGKNLDLVMDLFEKDINRCNLVIAHNIAFDKSVYIAESLRKGKTNPFLNKTCYCTMMNNIKLCDIKARSKSGKQYTKYPKLSELHNHIFKISDISQYNLHNSLVDVIICLKCYIKLNLGIDIIDKNKQLKTLLYNK